MHVQSYMLLDDNIQLLMIFCNHWFVSGGIIKQKTLQCPGINKNNPAQNRYECSGSVTPAEVFGIALSRLPFQNLDE